MFRTTVDPSSGNLLQYLDVVGVIAAYAAITPTTSTSTNTIEPFFVILAKHCTRLSDDESSVIRNMSEHF